MPGMTFFLNASPDDGGWLSKALVGAVIAALGYVGKEIWDAWTAFQKRKEERKAQLVQLQSRLRATKVSIDVQIERAQELIAMLRERNPNLNTSEGYDQTLANSFRTMNPAERELHAIIRSVTVNALKPANAALGSWIDEDTYFKTQDKASGPLGVLAKELAELQEHLIVWNAKFQVWIPERPEHALVFLADEKEHGIGFPSGIDETVAKVLSIL
jgi:hypothetical protein